MPPNQTKPNQTKPNQTDYSCIVKIRFDFFWKIFFVLFSSCLSKTEEVLFEWLTWFYAENNVYQNCVFLVKLSNCHILKYAPVS